MFDVTGLNAKEFDLVTKALRDYREEKAKQKAIEANNQFLREVVTATIDTIGLDETKRIIKSILANLRRASVDHI